jgi:Lon protease-like protein
MTDDQMALAAFNGTVRLFPLPNLVLFPQVIQGLHIFEPRYRQLTADTISSDLLMALVLLQPGWEKDYDGRPPVFSVACLGRISHYEQLPDGRYNLRFKGLARVRLKTELPVPKLYRVAEAEIVPDITPNNLGRLASLRKLLADIVLPRFPADGPAHRQLRELFQSDTPLANLCDLLAYALPLPLELKQQLLEEPDVQVRVEVMASALKIRSVVHERKFPPDFSVN